MPELPEVETVRRALVPAMEGRRISNAYIGRPDLRWPLPDNLAARLTGRMVGPLSRRGKFLLVSLDGDETMLMHLGMSGSVRIHHKRPAIGRHDHMVLEMAGAAAPAWIVFNDPRRFGWIDLFGDGTHPMLAGMGPEPLGNEFLISDLLQESAISMPARRCSVPAYRRGGGAIPFAGSAPTGLPPRSGMSLCGPSRMVAPAFAIMSSPAVKSVISYSVCRSMGVLARPATAVAPPSAALCSPGGAVFTVPAASAEVA
jgi:hypothetical protein